MGCTHCKGRNCGINTVNTGLNSLKKRHRAKTCGVVGVKMHGNRNAVLDGLNKLICLVGLKKTRHILNANGICAHFLKLLCISCEAVVGMEGRCGIGDRRLNVTLFLDSRFNCGLKVSCIVKRIKDTNNINAVCNGLLNEVLNYVVSIVTVAENVLSTEEHLELCIFNVILDSSESCPGILVKETKAGIECSAAPCLKRMISNLIHINKDRNHFLGCHTGCRKGLMCVSKDGFCN